MNINDVLGNLLVGRRLYRSTHVSETSRWSGKRIVDFYPTVLPLGDIVIRVIFEDQDWVELHFDEELEFMDEPPTAAENWWV